MAAFVDRPVVNLQALCIDIREVLCSQNSRGLLTS